MPAPAKSFHPPENRAAALTGARNFKMARSAHAYVRGSTAKFYEWLGDLAPSALPAGPAVWICGDCHIGNLGPVADAQGRVEIQIRDFDQAVIGNPVHDLIRLGLSLSMAARGSDLPGITTARMMEQLIAGYTEAFRARAKSAVQPDVVTNALRESAQRTWRHLARERIAGSTARIPLGKRFWPVEANERAAIEKLFRSGPMKAMARGLAHRPDSAKVKLADVAYWRKGCSSLGLLRYALLLDVAGRSATGRDLCLVDIKEATRAVAPHYEQSEMPGDNAVRVVEAARHMSPFLGERMFAAKLLSRPVFVRELLPEDLKLELTQIGSEEAALAARYFARVVGTSHARQMQKDERRRWARELHRNHSKSLDAPSWLWRSIVELIATHERAYLDHCRRYAMEAA